MEAHITVDNNAIIQYIKDNYKLYEEPYLWSTFILPSGEFIAPENNDYEDFGEHANIIAGVAENCFNDNWYEAERWLELNCVKCNETYPYIDFPQSPTNQQYYSAADWIDTSYESNLSSFDVVDATDDDISKMTYPLYVSVYGKCDHIFDVAIYDGGDIINRVKRARISGVLEESINQSNLLTQSNISYLIRLECRDSRVRDNNGNLISCSLLPHESLDNSLYGIYFKRGNDYYLNITTPLFTNETADIVTYLRRMGYEKELDRFKLMKRVQYDYQVNEVEFVKYLGFDGVITYDKELFIAFNKNQVIPVDYNPPKIHKTIVGDVVLKEDSGNQIDDKTSISIDDNLKLVVSELMDDTITYDILKDVVTVGYITILPKEQYLKAIEIYNDSEKGKGIGTKVLTYLIKNDIIDSLDVDKLNYDAQRLYLRLGFKPYQLIWGSNDGNGNDRYVMIHTDKLNNYYVYYQGDSNTTTYADEDCVLIANMKNGKVYFDVSIEDTVWEDLNDLNIYYEDIEEMLYTMKEGRLY